LKAVDCMSTAFLYCIFYKTWYYLYGLSDCSLKKLINFLNIMKKILLNSLAGIVFAFFGMQEIQAQPSNTEGVNYFVYTPYDIGEKHIIAQDYYIENSSAYVNNIKFSFNYEEDTTLMLSFDKEVTLIITKSSEVIFSGREDLIIDQWSEDGTVNFIIDLILDTGLYDIKFNFILIENPVSDKKLDMYSRIKGEYINGDALDVAFFPIKIEYNSLKNYTIPVFVQGLEDVTYLSSEDVGTRVVLNQYVIANEGLDDFSIGLIVMSMFQGQNFNYGSFLDFEMTIESEDGIEMYCTKDSANTPSYILSFDNCQSANTFLERGSKTIITLSAIFQGEKASSGEMHPWIYLYELSGRYSGDIQVSNINVTSRTIYYQADLTSLEELEQQKVDNFLLYPNPVNDGKITITIINTKEGSDISIYSIEGKVVLSQKVQSSSEKIDIAHLSPGSYIVRIGEYTKKLIVN
jgi:hypothetical protein